MKKFLVNQMMVDKKDSQGIGMASIIRIVFANTKEEAIGKFIIATESLKAIQKLDVSCYELDTITIIN